MKHIGKSNKGINVPYAVCFGLGVSFLISAILTGTITALISSENLSFGSTVFAVPVIQLLSAFAGCLLAGLTSENDKAIASGAVGALYYLLLIGCSGLFLNGVSGGFWIGLLTVFTGWLAAFFLCTREKSSARKAKHRKSYS